MPGKGGSASKAGSTVQVWIYLGILGVNRFCGALRGLLRNCDGNKNGSLQGMPHLGSWKVFISPWSRYWARKASLRSPSPKLWLKSGHIKDQVQ